MSHQTYWLNKRDAEFVINAVEHYDHVTQTQAERSIDSGTYDPVYEVSVTIHQRRIDPAQVLTVEYPTLHSALSADARSLRDATSTPEDASDFLI